jgi:hypothetical protein
VTLGQDYLTPHGAVVDEYGATVTSEERNPSVHCEFRPALGPTQPPVQWVPGVLSPGVKARPGRDAELYLLSPQAPPCRVAGLLYLYLTTANYT